MATFSMAERWTIVAAAVIGAAVGSKVLYWLEDPLKTGHHWNELAYLLAGKTITGALLEALSPLKSQNRDLESASAREISLPFRSQAGLQSDGLDASLMDCKTAHMAWLRICLGA